MKAKKFRRVVSLALAVVLALGLCAGASAADSRVQTCAEETAAFLTEATAQPQPGQTGGEWLVIGLARSGLMRQLAAREDVTVAQFAQAVSAIYYSRM